MKAFQFIEGMPSSACRTREIDKENMPTEEIELTTHKATPDLYFPPEAHSLPDFPEIRFPSTPATRLPLADLIGTTDDGNKSNIMTYDSPEDQIAWRIAKRYQSPKAKEMREHRGQKRARSSSPPSSSTTHPKHAYISNDKTPIGHGPDTAQLDPTADVWERYSFRTSKDKSPVVLVPSAANLPEASTSNASNAQVGNVSGLRRWTSCGVTWPESRSARKRIRRLDVGKHIEDVGRDLLHNSLPYTEEMRLTRTDSLLKRVQESLAKPVEADDAREPSSSSPLPNGRASFDGNSSSPSPTSLHASRQNGLAQALPVDIAKATSNDHLATSNARKPNAVGIRGDALDSGDVPVIDVFAIGKAESNSAEESGIEAVNGALLSDRAPYPVVVNDDDYGSDDFANDEFSNDQDLSVAEFETVASMYDPGGCNFDAYHQPATTPSSFSALRVNALHDDFDDGDIDEASFVAAEVAATQSHPTCKLQTLSSSCAKEVKSQRKSKAIQRYLTVDVFASEYVGDNGTNRSEKILLVEDEATKQNKLITLRDSWLETPCSKGSYVHVIGEFSATGQCLIDDTSNMLILHPDQLISALVVADSYGCLRRAVLQDRVKATSEPSPQMVYGTMLHEVFQEALLANKWDEAWLRSIVDATVDRHIEDLYSVRLTVVQAVEHLQSKLPEMQSWAGIFLRSIPEADAVVKDRNGKHVLMSVTKLLDVEEHIWSPMYGLKGNIDATVQVNMHDENGERTLIVPLEVKTGRNTTNSSHRAQTSLYSLLLSDRYDVTIAYGLLYYLETSEICRIPRIRHELRHIVMQRNTLACYVRERLSLPPMLKNAQLCNRCYAKSSCFLYHKLVEDGNGETSGLREKFENSVQHLQSIHQDFFKKWDDLLTKEESEMVKFKRELWTMWSTDREKVGRCFANVILERASQQSASSEVAKINRFRYAFRKISEITNFSFKDSQIIVGEPIVVSDEQGHYALAKGYVTSIENDHIVVAVDRKLHNTRNKLADFEASTNQNLTGVMNFTDSEDVTPLEQQRDDSKPRQFRIDKDEFSNGMAIIRNNLIRLMTDDVVHYSHIRRLVVEGVEPRFKPAASAYTLSGTLSQVDINEDQMAAIDKVMTAEDYALILGMPGTGKTTAIAHIIRALVAQGKSVLLTSYTHTAVDNILLKIRHDNIGILRLGAVAKVHPEVREFAAVWQPKTTLEELHNAYHDPQVVATTCLGINHQLFNQRTFDFCIVDEASQITLPVCLGPICMAKAFVLVGDHFQLPPLVRNREAQEGGLDVSLFRLLSEQHPSAVVALGRQYRMNSAIMSISNELIYSGRLKCGSESIAMSVLDIPNWHCLDKVHNKANTAHTSCPAYTSTNCWLNETLSPQSLPVVFLNTDTVTFQSREVVNSHGSRITNPLEATIIAQLVRALLVIGVAPNAIGVITLYRSQLALVKSFLHSAEFGLSNGEAGTVEAHTADRFQGRDKDVVLLSCVRSNEKDIVGELLKDWRRVNVAVTRARRKLVIVGSKSTLAQGDALLRRLVELCDREKWTVDLPADAVECSSHIWTANPQTPTAVLAQASPQKDRKPQTIKSTIQTQNTTRPVVRTPLGPRTANTAPFKIPAKVGKVAKKAFRGAGSVRENRPVFADLVNDIVGEDFFD